MEEKSQQQLDEQFMRLALIEARQAMDEDEIPIGAVVVCKGQVIARAHNLTERLTDVTAHAETLRDVCRCYSLGTTGTHRLWSRR